MGDKSCGRCQYFTKRKHLVGDSGLCEYFDSRTKADYGHECKFFKSIKYDRQKEKKVLEDG